MTNWSKSAVFGGIYPAPFRGKEGKRNTYSALVSATSLHRGNWTSPGISQLEKAKESWQKLKKIHFSIKNNLKIHISEKQEVYWPVLIAIVLLLFTFASKIASAETIGAPNNLPIESKSKLNLIDIGRADESAKICLANSSQDKEKAEKDESEKDRNDELKNDIAKIVKNTPMAAMIDSISEKDRTVAAFIVGIAMKESKFGVYAPHVGGRDCYNYWGLKAGGRTTAGGYTCFASPEDAVSVVGKTVEKMVAKGVRTPAQAISWKCGSSCAGHDPTGVRKWIADVGVNFYKINS
jgi:hypothetical protein